VVVELEPGEGEPLELELLEKLGVDREVAGSAILYMTKSRRVQRILLKEVLRRGARLS